MDDAVEVLLALTEAHLSQSAVYAARCEQRGGYLDAPSREVLRAHQFAHRAAANKLLSRAKELQTAAGVPVRGVWPDEVDAAALRSIESDVRHLVDAKLPDYQPAAGALRGLQLLMERHGIARNVGGRLVPPGVAGLDAVTADAERLCWALRPLVRLVPAGSGECWVRFKVGSQEFTIGNQSLAEDEAAHFAGLFVFALAGAFRTLPAGVQPSDGGQR